MCGWASADDEGGWMCCVAMWIFLLERVRRPRIMIAWGRSSSTTPTAIGSSAYAPAVLRSIRRALCGRLRSRVGPDSAQPLEAMVGIVEAESDPSMRGAGLSFSHGI